jgi:hypothetical protein
MGKHAIVENDLDRLAVQHLSHAWSPVVPVNRGLRASL